MTSSITTTPAASNGKSPTTSRPGSPFARISSKQIIVTSIPMNSVPSAAPSPNTPSLTTSPTNTSIQSSPEGPRGRNLPLSYSPASYQLPESSFYTPKSPNQGAMSEAFPSARNPGIIRKLSQRATQRLINRRQPSANAVNRVSNRDNSSGPVIMRHRSESKNSTDIDVRLLDLGREGDGEETSEESMSVHGLGLSSDGTTSRNQSLMWNPPMTEGGIAPIVPSILRRGTVLTKVTKKKRKNMTFCLDTDSAKVSWNPANPSKRFYIDDIQQVRLQRDARNYREEFQVSADSESCWFTIIYADQDRAKGRAVKTMHLIAPNQHMFELWTSTLDDLRKYRRELMLGLAGSCQDEKTLRGHWNREMAKLFGEESRLEEAENLDLAGVESLCRSLHINCSKNLLRAQFSKADTNQTGFLSFEEFKDFVRRLKERSDIKDVYRSLTRDSPEGLTLESFLGFLKDIQGIDVHSNRAHWQKVFVKFVCKAQAKLNLASDVADESCLRMSAAAFAAFLTSTYNNIHEMKAPDVKLDRPLNEYFISSSHNTYLLGRQFAGSSSTEAYIRALQRACRCVEIDCWDGPDGWPIVSHGRTMTTSVLFSDCISVIGKYAFVSSQYPLILSLEVHCNPVQQQVMVDIMTKELGDRLVTKPYMTNVLVLPSPEDLRNRILVKVKAGEVSLTRDAGIDIPIGRRQRSLSSPFARPQILDNTFIPNAPLLSSPPSTSPPEFASPAWDLGRGSATGTSISSATDDSDTAQGGTVKPRQKKRKHRSKIITTLGNLGVYTSGLKFEDFTQKESKAYNHIFSIAERQFEGLCRDQDLKAQLEKHNMRYLMRVYPSGFRMKSTNPDPLVFWRRGAQMVALNWQTYDLGMQMNEAMFANGSDRTGYVLKPRELRQPKHLHESPSNPMSTEMPKTPRRLIRFSVDMISAQQIPRPRGPGNEEYVDPYVEIEMFSAEDKGKGIASGEGGQDASARNGMSGIGSPHRRRTAVVQSNGFNPIFNEKFKLSLETKYPSLVFVRWTIWNSLDGRNYNNSTSSSPVATFTAKLESLQQGYRHLPLYDHNGNHFIFATLFCKIMKEEPITIVGEDPTAEKVGRFKQFGQAVFKRTLSMERKKSKDE